MPTWASLGSATWLDYATVSRNLFYANTDGHVYYHSAEALAGASDFEGYRIEPILDFGDPKRKDLLEEIWFGIVTSATFSITVWHRSGDTSGEVESQAWTNKGTIACNSDKPFLRIGVTARLHQIKWGTNSKDEKFEVNSIEFRYIPDRIK